jgi:hypothetical protein
MAKIACIDPTEIEEGDLIAYLHGDASLQVIEHVIRCAFCADQVEQLRMVDAQLLDAFYRGACPSAETLADFALNRLPAVEKLRVAAHVRCCELCSRELEVVHSLTDEAPPSLLAQLRESLALALVARPVVSAPSPVRGEHLQGRFEVDGIIITFSIQASTLTGRVRRRDSPPDADYGDQAWLLGETIAVDKDIPHSQVDRWGRFRFTSLATGSYALLLQIGDQNVALEEIQIE